MSFKRLWQAYLSWLNFRKPAKRTPLLGNPMELSGHAPNWQRRASPFQRAQFGKYEKRRARARKLRIALSVLVTVFLIWLAFESIRGLAIFMTG